MATIFSDVLTQLRKDSGFATAYSFYHDNGGAPVLKVSYRKYLMMEQGEDPAGFRQAAAAFFCPAAARKEYPV